MEQNTRSESLDWDAVDREIQENIRAYTKKKNSFSLLFSKKSIPHVRNRILGAQLKPKLERLSSKTVKSDELNQDTAELPALVFSEFEPVIGLDHILPQSLNKGSKPSRRPIVTNPFEFRIHPLGDGSKLSTWTLKFFSASSSQESLSQSSVQEEPSKLEKFSNK